MLSTRAAASIAALALLASAPPSSAKEYTGRHFAIACGDAVLIKASGVTKKVHQYEFKAACHVGEYGNPFDDPVRLAQWPVPYDKQGIPYPGGISLIRSVLSPVYVHGTGRWTPADQTAKEQLIVSGAISGEIRSDLAGCYKDPFLRHASHCSQAERSIKIDPGHPQAMEFTLATQYLKHFPIIYRAFEFDYALAMSNNSQEVPPPPPPKSVVRVPVIPPQAGGGGSAAASTAGLAAATGVLSFEAEALLAQGRLSVRGGKLAQQAMGSFGPGWSGGAQVLWSGGAPGSVLKLSLPVQKPGQYRVELRYTRAPDFGDVVAALGTTVSTKTLSGHATKVVPAGPADAGIFLLAAGDNQLELRLIGKQPLSKDYFFGLDEVRLLPVQR